MNSRVDQLRQWHIFEVASIPQLLAFLKGSHRSSTNTKTKFRHLQKLKLVGQHKLFCTNKNHLRVVDQMLGQLEPLFGASLLASQHWYYPSISPIFKENSAWMGANKHFQSLEGYNQRRVSTSSMTSFQSFSHNLRGGASFPAKKHAAQAHLDS
jgi:hypothetical protein